MEQNEYGEYECCGRSPLTYDCDNDKCTNEVCWSYCCSKCGSEELFCNEEVKS